MNKLGTKIIITIIMVAIFLAPISAGVKVNDKGNLAIKVETNKIIAQDSTYYCYDESFFEKSDISNEDCLKKTGYKWMTRAEAAAALASSRQKDPSKKICFDSSGFSKADITTEADCLKTTGNVWKTAGEQSYDKAITNPNFDCGLSNLGGCVLQVFFYLWEASALVATLAGHFLDFFIYYATDSSSYTNTFVSKAWGAVRDIANIFFIVALLYVAIKTILGLNVTDNKKLIGAVIIVGLIINFSLFTTKIVIDGSNILAKVFYNNITSTKAGTTDAAIEAGGEKSISIGLIDKFDPQNIVMDAYNAGLGLGYAIFLTLLLMAITLYTAYIFFSVAILFVARVVSLWLSMIFSPIAFASYTVPFDIPGFGHKEWWKSLLENAFLAPFFIFFLYVIVMFTEFLGEITKYQSDPNLSDFTSTIRRLMTMIIPFIIIVMLLTKAKKLAVKFSGDMGQAIMTGAKMIGGAALGAGAGMAAFGLRQGVGRVAANAAESQRFQDWAARSKIGASALKMTSGIGKGSFDVRGIKVAGKDLSSTGLKVNAFGKPQAGGFAKARAEKIKGEEEFADKLLDVSDKGKAELTRGGMSVARATKLKQQMADGGMAAADQLTYYNQMIGSGITPDDLGKVSRYLNARKRDVYADRIEKRALPSILGVLQGSSQKISVTRRMAANKVRQSADSAAKKANIAALAASLAAASGTPTAPPPTGGGTAGGGTHTP